MEESTRKAKHQEGLSIRGRCSNYIKVFFLGDATLRLPPILPDAPTATGAEVAALLLRFRKFLLLDAFWANLDRSEWVL